VSALRKPGQFVVAGIPPASSTAAVLRLVLSLGTGVLVAALLEAAFGPDPGKAQRPHRDGCRAGTAQPPPRGMARYAAGPGGGSLGAPRCDGRCGGPSRRTGRSTTRWPKGSTSASHLRSLRARARIAHAGSATPPPGPSSARARTEQRRTGRPLPVWVADSRSDLCPCAFWGTVRSRDTYRREPTTGSWAAGRATHPAPLTRYAQHFTEATGRRSHRRQF
jgi:hypothetical protein